MKAPLETVTREKLEEKLRDKCGITMIKDNGPIDGDQDLYKFPQGRLTPGAFKFDGFKGAFLQMTHEYELTIVTAMQDEFNPDDWLGSLKDSTITALEKLKNDIIKALYDDRLANVAGMPNSTQVEVLGGTVYPREGGSNFAGIIINLSFKTSAQ